MYCSKCGNEIENEAVICPKCGCKTSNFEATQNEVSAQEPATDGLIAASILIPIIGIILGIVKLCQKKTKAGTTYLLCGIISWIVFAFILGMMSGL